MIACNERVPEEINYGWQDGELGARLSPMARKIRIEYSGAAYHVAARGNQGRDRCGDERDRMLWPEELEKQAGI